MLKIILFSGLSGIIGTSLGGIIGIIGSKKSEQTISIILNLSAGIMIAISMFDLMPEAYEVGNLFLVTLGVILGVIFVGMLNLKLENEPQNAFNLSYNENIPFLQNNTKKRMFKTGIIMLLAVSLHNIPEGLAIGAAGVVSINLSFALALLLAFHNIPEGMAIASPLFVGGVKKIKIILLLFVAGAVTIIGGIIGSFLGSISNTSTALALAFAAGAMLYVSFCEILPQSILLKQNYYSNIFILMGILMGFLMTNLL